MFACHEDNDEIVMRLLQVPGVNINHKDDADWTPQHEADAGGHSECLKELAKMPLFAIVRGTPQCSGNPDCVRIILAQPGLDLTVKDEDSLSLTEVAVTSLLIYGEFGEIVEILVDPALPCISCIRLGRYEEV